MAPNPSAPSTSAPTFQERTEAFPNGHLLWSPAQLKARLEDPKLALIDLRSAHEIMAGVIPGAAHFDLYGLGLSTTEPPLFDELANLLRSLLALRGVGMEKTVVFYEQQTGVRTGRAFWLLEYFGHKDVHVLDGGYDAWVAAGYAVVREMAAPHSASFKVEPQKHIYIGADELRKKIEAGEIVPLDTRGDDEYFGRNKRGTKRGGAIPGAIHIDHERYIDENGRYLPASKLEALFRDAGLTKDKAIAPY